jgi:hypothetical protein
MSIWEANCYSKFNLLIKKEKLDGHLRHIVIKWPNWNVEELTGGCVINGNRTTKSSKRRRGKDKAWKVRNKIHLCLEIIV